ncbi:MAG: hypothetical protein AB3N15_05000 [Paracoccaceae bacterium]
MSRIYRDRERSLMVGVGSRAEELHGNTARGLFWTAVAIAAFVPMSLQAQSSPQHVVETVIDLHLDYCGQAMDDPGAFLKALPELLPAGTFGTRTSPDGRLFRLTISTGGGKYSTHFSRYMFEDRGHENCATYLVSPDAATQSDKAFANAFEQAAIARFGKENVRGGSLPELYASHSGGSDVLEENSLSHEFLTRNVLSDANDLTFTHVTGGYVSLVTHRELLREGG